MLGAIVAVGDAERVSAARIDALERMLRAHADQVAVIGPGSGDPPLDPLPAAAGYLRALAQAVHLVDEDHAIVLAADLTHPSSELLRYLVSVRGSHAAVLPEGRGGRLQPLLGLYHSRLARRVDGLLAAGERDLQPLLDVIEVRRITPEEVAKFGDPDRLLARDAPHSSM